MKATLTARQIDSFRETGYLVVESLLNAEQIEYYRQLYDRFLDGTIRMDRMRSDLGGHTDRKRNDIENVTQIMWPSQCVPVLHLAAYHRNALSLARQLLGDDLIFDFDMLIDKAPRSDTPTPWHQDASYWPHMPDARAASCWLALDEATVDNGCMWFVPGSHTKPLRSHRQAGRGGGALECDAAETEGVAVPLKPGSATFHDGRTLHYSRGNSTDSRRRAFIVNFRPAAMVRHEREQGFDHGLTNHQRVVRNVQAR